jgi:shikimate kinase
LKEWKNYDHVPPAVTSVALTGLPTDGFEPSGCDTSCGDEANHHPPWEHCDQMSAQARQDVTGTPISETALVAALGLRSVVLVGMMGAGKSSIGRRLAGRLGIAFADADTEIEVAAQMTIPDIFSTYGEADFRAGETRVIARLLEGGPQVLATGGGAFMNPDTRAAIAAHGVSIWLKAEFEVLMRRIKRRQDRPLLKTDDPGETLRALMAERYPVYAQADITIQSREVPHDKIVDEIVGALAARLTPALDAPDAATDGGVS